MVNSPLFPKLNWLVFGNKSNNLSLNKYVPWNTVPIQTLPRASPTLTWVNGFHTSGQTLLYPRGLSCKWRARTIVAPPTDPSSGMSAQDRVGYVFGVGASTCSWDDSWLNWPRPPPLTIRRGFKAGNLWPILARNKSRPKPWVEACRAF